MTSSYFTFNLRYDLNIQRIQALALPMPMSKYQVSTEAILMKEGKLQEYQINVIQMYKLKLPKYMLIQYYVFKSLVNEKTQLCFSSISD